MSTTYARPLLDEQMITHFFKIVLKYDFRNNVKIISQVAQSELSMSNLDPRNHTFNSKSYRQRDYAEDDVRWDLRRTIVKELYENVRLKFDDDIKLGSGGALPNTDLQRARKAFVIIGPPASGKSGVANKIADKYGAIILDSDYAKRKIPEFENYQFGATLVHTESDAIIFGGFEDDQPDDFSTLFELCIITQANIVIPKIGHNYESIAKLAKTLKDEFNYEVHLTLVNLDKVKATKRAIERFKNTKRYVPLGLIFDGYGNDPILSYYILKCKELNLFASFGEVSTDVVEGSSPLCLECVGENPSSIYLNI